ncbi:MAG: MMPL family transporter, partial [Nitrosomonas sp.]|nr:MMPL family transporter [Nitrosomonas sp.]
EAIDELRTGRKLDLDPVLNGVSATLDAQQAGSPRALSWQTLFTGDKQEDTYQELILVRPKLDFSQLFAAEEPIAAVRKAAITNGITDEAAKSLRITGSVALAFDELNSAMHGAQDAGILALALVAVVLFLALRASGAVVAVLLSLILGLILTATFATFAIGHLNLISIAFAVLYIGLGVDYAIHFLLRHQELKTKDNSTLETLYTAGGDIGSALMICAITTAIGFYAFMPTTYEGVAELGLISGTGMIISLIVTLTIAPALQRYLPARKSIPTIREGWLEKTLALPSKLHKTIYALTLVAFIAAIYALPQIRFDYNLLNLNNPHKESVLTFRELLAEADDSPWHAIALADDEQEARQVVAQLTDLPEVDKVVTLFDLEPKNQEMKHFLINEMALTLGPIALTASSVSAGNYTLAQQRQALETLDQALNQFITAQPKHATTASIRALSTSLTHLLTQLDSVSTNEANQLLDSASRDLLGLLPDALERLQIAFGAQPFTLQELPDSLSSHWHSPDDVFRIAIYPTENINDNDALRRFVRAIQHEAPQVTGPPVISLEAGEAVVDAFIHAFSLALIGVVLALLILLRNITSTVLVMIPLLLAALFTSAATVWFNVPFNFANIIALPLLLGIGIDSSIHMVHRSRNTVNNHKNLLHTSTARAILYSALTTLVGFGSLAYSPHQGTASMGLLLAVGVLLTLICVLIILPALLHTVERREARVAD